MNQEQPRIFNHVEQQQMLGRMFGGGSSSPAPSPTPAPQPAPPPNVNPTVQTGDNQLASDNAAAQVQEKAAASGQNSTLLTTQNAVTQSNQATAKKTLLGG